MDLEVSSARVGDGDAGHHMFQVAHALVRAVGTGGGQSGGPQRLHQGDAPGRGGGSSGQVWPLGVVGGGELGPLLLTLRGPCLSYLACPEDVCHSGIGLERLKGQLLGQTKLTHPGIGPPTAWGRRGAKIPPLHVKDWP